MEIRKIALRIKFEIIVSSGRITSSTVKFIPNLVDFANKVRAEIIREILR